MKSQGNHNRQVATLNCYFFIPGRDIQIICSNVIFFWKHCNNFQDYALPILPCSLLIQPGFDEDNTRVLAKHNSNAALFFHVKIRIFIWQIYISYSEQFLPVHFQTVRQLWCEFAGRKKCWLAERGFDPRTSGLWAQHASTAPLCFCQCYLIKALLSMKYLCSFLFKSYLS